jgi:hypothetical protein
MPPQLPAAPQDPPQLPLKMGEQKIFHALFVSMNNDHVSVAKSIPNLNFQIDKLSRNKLK